MNKTISGDKSLAGKIADEIMDLILDKPYRPGTRLPNECDMALQLGVGRSTVREALKALATRNVVDIRHGSGTFVRQNIGVVDDPLGFRFRRDRKNLAIELCEMRLIIEPEIAAMAAKNASERDILDIRKLALDIAFAHENGEEHTRYDIDFHIRIAQATGNSVAPKIISILSTAISVIDEVTEKKLMAATLSNHEKVMNAIRDHNPARARRAMLRHIEFNLDHIRAL